MQEYKKQAEKRSTDKDKELGNVEIKKKTQLTNTDKDTLDLTTSHISNNFSHLLTILLFLLSHGPCKIAQNQASQKAFLFS